MAGGLKKIRRGSPGATKRPALTVSRPELLVDGSDNAFRRLVQGFFAMRMLLNTLREYCSAAIGLGGIEFMTLIAVQRLSEQGDVGVQTVADYTFLSGAFITETLNHLQAKKLIERKPHPTDKRRVCLEVTGEGIALLERLAPIQCQVNDIAFGCLSAREFSQLLAMIERLTASAEQAVAFQRYLSASQGIADIDKRLPLGKRISRV